jgi:RimJ/RimL family protein N-acetyltransferase
MDNAKVIFKTPISEEIVNFKTGEKCLLVSNENPEAISNEDINKIVEICNQPAVYDFLFRSKLAGKPYQANDAREFIRWMAEGWKKQEWFVFLVRNSQGEIIAAIDIKSNNLESAEIGYWADKNFPGTISNAANKMIDLAAKAGFKSLYATTKPNNTRSQSVLIRNGFVNNGKMEKPNGERLKFIRNMVETSNKLA